MTRRPIPEVSITELFEHYGGSVTGRDNTPWRKATCPLHEDSTASAVVNEDEGKFRCFTCDVGGDAIQLVMEVEGVSGFLDALAKLEEFAERGDGTVRAARRSSSLVPRRSGNHERGRGFVPPWLRR